jgi:hypothetical protein
MASLFGCHFRGFFIRYFDKQWNPILLCKHSVHIYKIFKLTWETTCSENFVTDSKVNDQHKLRNH